MAGPISRDLLDIGTVLARDPAREQEGSSAARCDHNAGACSTSSDLSLPASLGRDEAMPRPGAPSEPGSLRDHGEYHWAVVLTAVVIATRGRERHLIE
jgi:hypothetical protein